MTVGIDAIGAYCGVARIEVEAVFDGRGLDRSRLGNLMMRQRAVQWPWEDPVTNAVNAAWPLLETLDEDARRRVELLIVSTESGLDYSKSVASYVHAALGLSRQCRILEVKQACYGATGALQLAAALLASGADSDARALVVATDVNPMDARAGYAEPTTGHGAVALLVGTTGAALGLDRNAYGLCSFEVMDTARPLPDLDVYNADLSLLTYLDCLAESFRAYTDRVPGADFRTSFEHLVFHTPFAGMVKAAHRKMARNSGATSVAEVAEDYERRVAPSLEYLRDVGNLCSGSIYLALAALIDSRPAAELAGARIGLFSYGSGCASEFFSGVLPPGGGPQSGTSGLRIRLDLRRMLSFREYEDLIERTRDSLVPRRDHVVDLSSCQRVIGAARPDQPTLVLERIDAYHRKYRWWE